MHMNETFFNYDNVKKNRDDNYYGHVKCSSSSLLSLLLIVVK